MQINYEKKCTSRILSGKMDEAAGIESPTNKQKGTTPQVIAKAENTWRIESAGMDIRAAAMGYTRIEASRAGELVESETRGRMVRT